MSLLTLLASELFRVELIGCVVGGRKRVMKSVSSKREKELPAFPNPDRILLDVARGAVLQASE